MKILVAGGAGFLGSYVADKLTNQGHDVIIFDKNYSPYLCENQQMMVGDVLDKDAVCKTAEGCDVIYNFIGIAGIEEASRNPLSAININILGNANLLEAAKIHSIKRFIFSSSLYVYSSAGSIYKCTKQSSELIIETYSQMYNIDYTILRYGSLYGPRAGDDNWIYSILKSALDNNKIVRFGDGEEIREYIWIEDAALLSTEVLCNEFINKHVLITGSSSIKVKDLLIMIKEIFNDKLTIEFKPASNSYKNFIPAMHYQITPYSFNPKKGIKLTSRISTDLGQGILYLLNEINEKAIGQI